MTIYEEAVQKWSMDSRKLIVIEELSELVQELCNRCFIEHSHILEEATDALIVLEQLIIAFDIDKKDLNKVEIYTYKVQISFFYLGLIRAINELIQKLAETFRSAKVWDGNDNVLGVYKQVHYLLTELFSEEEIREMQTLKLKKLRKHIENDEIWEKFEKTS
jgi:hypothetical protein